MGNSNSKKTALEDSSPYCSRVVPMYICCGTPHTHKAKSCSSCHKWYCGESNECSRCNKPVTDPSLNPKSSGGTDFRAVSYSVKGSTPSSLLRPITTCHNQRSVTSKELRGEPKV